MKATVTAILAVLAILAAGASSVTAHEIKGPVVVDCAAHTATAHGIKFGGEGLPMTATVTGPKGYVVTFQITTDEWTATFPLGPNGAYSIDWPNSGDFGPVPFSVECAAPRPTPTPAAVHTPHPDRTLPPTDSTVEVRPLFDWTVIPVVALVLIAITGIVEGYLKRRAGR